MKKALLILHVAFLVYWMSTGYLRTDAMFFAGLGVLGSSLVVREPGQGSWRFGLLALLCIGMALAIPTRTFLFLALTFSTLFVVENYWGKINEVPLLTALLLTAGAKTMSVVLSFPMRLQLSENAATVLRLLGSNAMAEGNLIHFEGKGFLVDAACAGLQMVEVSFLFCFFLLGLFERQTGRHLRWPALLGAVLATAILILIFNQLRIVFLVLFNIPPENPMHDVVGLSGLALYVFAPLWWGLNWAYSKAVTRLEDGTRMEQIRRVSTDPSNKIRGNLLNLFDPCAIRVAKGGLHVLLISFLGHFTWNIQSNTTENHLSEQALIPNGVPGDCRKELLKDGVVKYANDRLLVYVKPIRGWYDTEHTPLICWQGSGYEFGQMQEQTIGSAKIYTAILEKKGSPKLFTAWWFDNGKEHTVSQARWRWLDAGGAPGFSLVNITASQKSILEAQIIRMTQ